MVDMEVIVRRQDRKHCASITCMIRHYVARRAQVIEDHPHNADERAYELQTERNSLRQLHCGGAIGEYWASGSLQHKSPTINLERPATEPDSPFLALLRRQEPARDNHRPWLIPGQ